MRGEQQIQAGMVEALKAATRNGHKKDPRSETLGFWFDKMYEEIGEVERAIMEVSDSPTPKELERVREEVGDAIYSIVCAADHGAMLDLNPDGVRHYYAQIGE